MKTATKLAIAIIMIATSAVTTTTTTIPLAYGQLEGYVSFSEVDPEHIEQIVSEAVSNVLEEGESVRVSIFDGGMFMINDDNGTPFEMDDDIAIHISGHNFTSANGYRFEDNTIYAPNGSVLFVD